MVNWKLWWVCVSCNFYNLQLYIISAISAISCKFSAICVLYMILNGISCSIELGFVCSVGATLATEKSLVMLLLN